MKAVNFFVKRGVHLEGKRKGGNFQPRKLLPRKKKWSPPLFQEKGDRVKPAKKKSLNIGKKGKASPPAEKGGEKGDGFWQSLVLTGETHKLKGVMKQEPAN